MQTRCLIPIAGLWMVFTAVAGLRAAEPDAVLEKQVPIVTHSAKDYDTLISDIKTSSGLQVKIDPEFEAYIKPILARRWSTWSTPISFPETVTLKQSLNSQISGFNHLRWELEGGTIRLLPDWQRDDARSTEELLKELRHFYEAQARASLEKGPHTDATSAARKPDGQLLNALLSKKENYGKSWKVRTMSMFEPTPLSIADVPEIMLAGDFANTDGVKGTLVVVRHPLVVVPGNGGFSYYFFAGDGRLVSAGLFRCGSRCNVDSASVKPGKEGAAPDLEITIGGRAASPDGAILEKYVLEPGGLVVTHMLNTKGAPIDKEDEVFYAPVSLMEEKTGDPKP